LRFEKVIPVKKEAVWELFLTFIRGLQKIISMSLGKELDSLSKPFRCFSKGIEMVSRRDRNAFSKAFAWSTQNNAMFL
jgi:hypothetical protein